MLYLSGSIQPELEHPRLGWMFSPNMGNRVPETGLWAMDNGCFADPEGFDWDRFDQITRRRLDAAGDRCLFVIAPDVPFDAERTLERFGQYRDRLMRLGVPIAFAVQNGHGVEDIPWRDIDALFIGGDVEWKFGNESAALVSAARARGKWVHLGRANSYKRLKNAYVLGCDSADGTFLKKGPGKNIPRMLGWFDALDLEPPMRLMA